MNTMDRVAKGGDVCTRLKPAAGMQQYESETAYVFSKGNGHYLRDK